MGISKQIGSSSFRVVPLGTFALLFVVPWAIVVRGEELAAAELVPTRLESPLEPLVPRVARTDAERHRLEALSNYAAGRMLERKGEFPQALQRYQRSARYDPARTETLRRIIVLSRSLNRHEETARYCVPLAEISPDEPIYLLLAAYHLSQYGDASKALRLYERALQSPGAPAKNAAWIELHKTAGEFYLRNKQYAQAVKAFAHVEQSLKKPADYELTGDTLKLVLGDKAALYRLLGETYLLADKPIRAIAAFEKADRATPGEGLLLVQLARVERRLDQHDRAITKLEKYMARKHETLGLAPYRLLEETLAEVDRSGELLDRLQAAHARDLKNDKLAYFLGEKLRLAGKLVEARRLFHLALAEEPTANTYESLAAIERLQGDAPALLKLLTDIAGRSGDLDILGAELKAIVANEKLTSKLIALAQQRAKALAEAELPAEPAEDGNPFHILGEADGPTPEAFATPLAGALLASEAGQHDVAAKLYESALAADPERRSQVLLSWGFGLLVDEEYERAVKVFRQGTLKPTPPLARPTFYFYLSGALATTGRTKQALDAARQAVALRSNSAEYRGRICWLLYRDGQHQAAAETYRQLVADYEHEFYASEIRDVVRDARLTLSSIYVRQGELAAGIEQLERVLDEFPDDIGALNDLGYLWADNGKNLELAERMIRRAVAADPDSKSYLDSLGWVLMKQGRPAEALPHLEKATAGEQASGVILDHFGDVLFALNRPAEARQAWRQAIEVFGEDESAEKAETLQKISRIKE